jgi:hypothetical protein
MPMAFRMYLLDNWLQTGVIDIKEYRRRQLFAVARDMSTPDEDQEARAKRVADAIRSGIAVPDLRWQDNEAIHQDVLEREILLQDDLAPEVIAAAQERWMALANQATQKQGGMGPQTPPQPAQGAGMSGTPLPPPANIPLSTANPPIGSIDTMLEQQLTVPTAEANAQMADMLSQQA